MAFNLKNYPTFRAEIVSIQSDLTVMLNEMDATLSGDLPEAAQVERVQSLMDKYLPD